MPKRPLTILTLSTICVSFVMTLFVATQGHSTPGPRTSGVSGKSKVSGHPPAAQQPIQTGQPTQFTQAIAQAVHHDVSPPLFLIHPPPRQPGFRIHDIEPVPRRYQPAAADPVLQQNYPPTLAPATTLNFDGVGSGFTGPAGTFFVQSAPPDTEGDVGPNHYIQVVNTDFAIFNKSGTAILGPVPINTLWQGFGGLCQTDNNGDPVVVYDSIADRWVISQLAVSGANGTSVPFLECVAVSQTPDPTGAYNRYAFGYNSIDDYPKIGVWPDAYYTTFNFFNPSGTAFLGGVVCAYDRTSMLAGQPATQQCFNVGTNYGGLLPADLDGTQLPPAGSPNYVLALGVSNNDLAFWKFHVDWTTPANTTLTGPTTITVAPYTAACNGGTCIPQAGTTQPLDSLADRLMFRLAYRNFGSFESLVTNHSVAAGSGVGLRWYEIRSPGTTPTVFQQGTYAPDSNFRWMGSIAMDQNGNMALGFSLSGSSLHPEIHYTGRLAGDPLGQMTQGEGTMINGAGSQTAGLSRWGDYSMMGIDPSDDCTFWYTQEYLKASATFNWSTRIGTFKLPNCGSSTPDFSLSTTPASLTVSPGSTAGYTENITATGGFAGSVSLSISGLPAGANGTFNPNPATGASSALTITTSSNTPVGSYIFTVTGTSTNPALTHTSTATLVVQSAGPPPAIAFVRAANNLIPGSVTSVSVANMVNNVGDALVVACRESAQITITSVTDTAGNSYTRIANALSTGRESALFFAVNVKGSAGNIITCNFASTIGRGAIVVEEFSGVVALDGFVTASNNSATTSLPSGNLVTTNANDLLVYEVNVGADNTFTAGPGYVIPAGGSNTRLGVQFTIVSSQGTYATLESWSTAAPADGVFAALKGGAGAPPPDFSLSTAPSSATVTAGSPASYTENITATGGFAGSVSLSISGLPAGANGTFNPNPATGASSALTITTSSTTPPGSYIFTVTGTSTNPALTHTSTATLVVQSPPDFSLSTTPSSATVTAGSPASYTENITATGGFAGSVSLSISGLPAGANGTFNPNPATGASSALTITTSSTTPAGSYLFTVTGMSTSPALTHTSTATLVVQSPPPPDFSLSTTPASVTVSPGSTASYTENITATGGFAGSVSLSISGLPVGANGTFNPNPATGSSSALTITTSSNTPVGSYVFTVTGTSTNPALTHTSTATLVVQSAGPPLAIAFVRAANNLIPGSVTSVSVANMMNNVGDMVVVACRESAQVTITSVTDTAGNSYTRIANALSTGRESALFFAVNVKGSAGNIITCNFASTIGRGAIVVEEFSGVVALDGFVTASNNSATTSLPSGNLVTTNANDLLVYEVNVGADNTFTAGLGYVIPAGGSNTRLGVQFTIVSSQGTYATSESWITAAPADGVFAAFK